MASKASRKSPVAKKPGGNRLAAAVGAKVRGAKAPAIGAKSKPSHSVVTASKNRPANGTPAARPTTVKPIGSKGKALEGRRFEQAPPRPIPEAVPTNGKPRKNQAGLSSKELEHFRDLLLEKRRELVGDM